MSKSTHVALSLCTIPDLPALLEASSSINAEPVVPQPCVVGRYFRASHGPLRPNPFGLTAGGSALLNAEQCRHNDVRLFKVPTRTANLRRCSTKSRMFLLKPVVSSGMLVLVY